MKLTIVPELFPQGSMPSLHTEPIAYRVTHAPQGRELIILLHDQEWKISDTGRGVSQWKNRSFTSAGEALQALDTEL